MSNTVNVRTFRSEVEAEIAKELLEANGIKAAVVADDSPSNRLSSLARVVDFCGGSSGDFGAV